MAVNTNPADLQSHVSERKKEQFRKGADGGKTKNKLNINMKLDTDFVAEIDEIKRHTKMPSRNALLLKWIGEGMNRDKP